MDGLWHRDFQAVAEGFQCVASESNLCILQMTWSLWLHWAVTSSLRRGGLLSAKQQGWELENGNCLCTFLNSSMEMSCKWSEEYGYKKQKYASCEGCLGITSDQMKIFFGCFGEPLLLKKSQLRRSGHLGCFLDTLAGGGPRTDPSHNSASLGMLGS